MVCSNNNHIMEDIFKKMINKKGEGLGTFGNILTGAAILFLLKVALSFGFSFAPIPKLVYIVIGLLIIYWLFKR